jgi:hypothetical protein
LDIISAVKYFELAAKSVDLFNALSLDSGQREGTSTLETMLCSVLVLFALAAFPLATALVGGGMLPRYLQALGPNE